MPNNLPPKRVLVVEDEPAIGQVCQRFLKSKGFDVDLAIDGLAAKKLLDEKTYDLCLSDIRMPNMNGIQLYQCVQQEHPDIACKFIFITGDVLSANVDQFLRECKTSYLLKPFTLDELKQTIRNTFPEMDI